MRKIFKDAGMICKTLMRNGYDAHIINAPLQEHLLSLEINRKQQPTIDIACDMGIEALLKLFPGAEPAASSRSLARLEEDGAVYNFYKLDPQLSSQPELTQLKITPAMIERMDEELKAQMRFTGYPSRPVANDGYEGFTDMKDGSIRILGIPDQTLRHNYLLAIRTLRFAANYDAPIEPNTWMAIVRASESVLDYVPPTDLMEEWRKVAAENMHIFVRLLFDAHLLQGFLPEIASLASVVQQNDKGVINGNVFEHTLKCMELYPRDGLNYDWIGTLAMLFHDVGKLYTAEFANGRWTYFQHHKVGAKVARKILRRFHFDQADADLICSLVNNHMRFHFMMTDAGLRSFMALGETERLIAMARADLISRDDSFTSFNHNVKYLERAETPEQLLKPLLDGNEIMKVANLSPGPLVGMLRDALLKAQRAGEVLDTEAAIAFVAALAGQTPEG